MVRTIHVMDGGGLKDLARAVRAAGRVGFDTEFFREKTYYARLCLVQVATPDLLAVVDPLAVRDLAPLLDALFDGAVLKVVHAAGQDFEIVHQMAGRVPAPVFDTQVAAGLAGFPTQTAYATLVRELLDVDLAKAHTYTDWCARPLSEAQIAYALDDVRHLLPLHDRLTARLRRSGRLGWLDADFAALADPDTYRVDPETQYLRVKGQATLDRRGLAVLRALAAWREREAQRRDLPRRWVLTDEAALAIARIRPESDDDLDRIRGLHGKSGSVDRRALLETVRQAVRSPEETWPRRAARRPPEKPDPALSDLLSALLRSRAERHGVAPQVLASREELERLARGEREGLPVLEGWRFGMAGRDLLALLDGRLSLKVRDGALAEEVEDAPGE